MKSLIAAATIPLLGNIAGTHEGEILMAGFSIDPATIPPWATAISMCLAALYLRSIVKENKEKHKELADEDKILHSRLTRISKEVGHLQGINENRER
jgi:hypothetical protein